MVTSKQAIDILFKEYDTLRSELITRHNGSFQLLTAGLVEASVCVGWFEKFGVTKSLWWLIGSFVVISGVIYFAYNVAIGGCATRVREIEDHINELAGVELLCWENRFGAGPWIFRLSAFWPKKRAPDSTGVPVASSDKWKILAKPDITDAD